MTKITMKLMKEPWELLKQRMTRLELSISKEGVSEPRTGKPQGVASPG